MWTIRIRWKVIYQIFVCSWKDHDWDQYYVIHPGWNSDDYFCKRCRLTRPASRQYHEPNPDCPDHDPCTRWIRETLDQYGSTIDRRVLGHGGKKRTPLNTRNP